MKGCIRIVSAGCGLLALYVPARVVLTRESPTAPEIGAMVILGIASLVLFAGTFEPKGGAK